MTDQPSIVVGMDHTPSSAAALCWAADEALRTGARVRAIHVWQCSDAALHQHLPELEREEVHENATRWVVEALARTSSNATVSIEVIDGVPGPTLVAAAADAVLLVLGANTFAPTGLPASALIEYCMENSPRRLVVIDGRDRRMPNTPEYASAGVSTP